MPLAKSVGTAPGPRRAVPRRGTEPQALTQTQARGRGGGGAISCALQPTTATTPEIFAGKRVILFAVPGP